MSMFLNNKFGVYHEADTGSNGGDGGQGGSEGGNGDDLEGGKEKDTEKDGIMIPKSRFDEVNGNYKSIKEELDALKDTQSKAQIEADKQALIDAEAKGEFESLYTEAKGQLESLSTDSVAKVGRIEALEGVINGLLETKLESIDKSFHDLIPESMTAEQKLAWVNSAESKGLFGSTSTEKEALGTKTNGNGTQVVDLDLLSPTQLMASGYSSK